MRIFLIYATAATASVLLHFFSHASKASREISPFRHASRCFFASAVHALNFPASSCRSAGDRVSEQLFLVDTRGTSIPAGLAFSYSCEQRVSASVYVSRSPSTGGKYPPFPGSGNRTEALHICPDLVQLIAEISGNRRSNIVEAFDKQRRKLYNQQIEKRIIHTCWKRNRSSFHSPCFPLLPVPSAKRGDEYETDGI